MRVFDGRSLRQWTGDTKYWSVKDGARTGTTDGSLKMNRFITWKHSTIRNFDLRVKVRVTEGGNSRCLGKGGCVERRAHTVENGGQFRI